jgi:glycosyltransferase involved in cell wall biosynthesis
MNTWVILPTYNEAANLERLVGALRAVANEVDVLVVDDASPDGTGAIAERLAAADPRVHVLHRAGERGLGTAYLAGFREALARGADALLTMDCDFSHDPGAVPALVAALDGADVVIGSRYVPGGTIEGWPSHRRVISKSANWFVHALFRLRAHDCTSGFRLYRRAVVEEIPWQRVRSTGYSFLVESLFWATRPAGRRVAEVAICFRDREHGASKLGWREAVYGARNLLRLKLENWR